MLDLLPEAEKYLLDVLGRDSPGSVVWKSMFVDYHHPHVERLWTPWKDYRLSLHRIHTCLPEESLFHPHPWPQAVRVLSGSYEMGVGWGKGDVPPPVATKLIVNGGFTYEMTDPDGWHYVRPIWSSLSIMITGKPWSRTSPKSEKPLRALTTGEQDALLYDIHQQLLKIKH